MYFTSCSVSCRNNKACSLSACVSRQTSRSYGRMENKHWARTGARRLRESLFCLAIYLHRVCWDLVSLSFLLLCQILLKWVNWFKMYMGRRGSRTCTEHNNVTLTSLETKTKTSFQKSSEVKNNTLKYGITHFFNNIKGESNVTIHLMRILLNYYISYRTIYFCHYLIFLYSNYIYFVLFTTSTKRYSGKFLENKITVQNKLLPRTAFLFLFFFFPIFHYFFNS